ncbi:MAG: hypothetical protein HOA17_02575 [Candidatus Melainabacteria bacterium]|jgi:DNA-directed RNA polymerase beta subunit|nr:hypothetical protein [Candidatus Melainabacteria bacterium]
MSELTQNPNIAALKTELNNPSSNLAQARFARAGIKANAENLSGNISDKDLGVLARFLASRLNVSEFMAFKMIRKFVGTGQASSLTDIKNFFLDFVKSGASERTQEQNAKAFEQLRRPETQSKTGSELEATFKPIVKDLGDEFVAYRQQATRNQANLVSKGLANTHVTTKPQLSNLITSPQAFASWLVNNRAAFLMLKSNPKLVQLLMAINNPNIAKSPVLLQEIYKMITQVIKLKRGKSQIDDIDEVTKENLDHAASMEASEHEANIVHQLKHVIEQMPIKSLRDFLLEAERFAEEEVANMWSLALKKEKELERKLGIGKKK